MGVTDQSVSSHASAQLYSADQDRRACISDSISCAWFMHGGCSCDVSPPVGPVWGGHHRRTASQSRPNSAPKKGGGATIGEVSLLIPLRANLSLSMSLGDLGLTTGSGARQSEKEFRALRCGSAGLMRTMIFCTGQLPREVGCTRCIPQPAARPS